MLYEKFFRDARGRVTRKDKYGALEFSIGYHSAGAQVGALAWARDALGRQTRYDNYKRGIPQSITRPDGVAVRRTVDNNGWVTSQTNARGFRTNYQYNSMGWLTRIDRPSPWADTTIAYSNIGSGIQQTTTRGTVETRVWHDALNRPYRERTRALSGGGVTSHIYRNYDALGRETFVSFPSTQFTPQTGTLMRYDALGRVTSTQQNVGPNATTRYDYLSGNRTRVTDAVGHQTITTRSGYGSPDDGNVVKIQQPEGVVTDMTYDIHGNLLTARQYGVNDPYGADQTQRYFYDSRFRLCRHSVPETGDTLYAYDAADQMHRYAEGQPAGTACNF
ncbi:MAG: hypothetical protein AAFQ96_08495, partial [Pseudomonadota bacterium]